MTGADGLLLEFPNEQWCAGTRGYVAGQSGVGSSVLMSPFLMCVVGYSFPNE